MGKYIPLLVILGIILFIVGFYNLYFKEGFTDALTSSVASSIEAAQADFVKSEQQIFNPIGLSLITNQNEGALGTSADPLISTRGSSKTYPLSDGQSGLFAAIKQCEAVLTTDCNAFDDPKFSASCGLCLDVGKNSKGVATTGGLVLFENARKYARKTAFKSDIPDYEATVGSCPANRLVSTKEECLKMKQELQCQKSGSYDISKCSQCFSDQSYTIIDNDPNTGIGVGTGTVYVIGTGVMNYNETGYSSGSGIQLSSKPYAIHLQGPETTRLIITVSSDSQNTKPTLAGYVSGQTQSGVFSLDLFRIAMTDTVTGRKPRTVKNISLGGTKVSTMAPGFGKTQMSIIFPMPFTFIDPEASESSSCKDTPFITTRASSEFLDSDPCYKKGSGPGKFSQECLQSLYLTNGCTESGKGYPGDSKSMATLMVNPDGSFRSLSDISDLIYQYAVSTATGIGADGKKLDIPAWSDSSVFCTGQVIHSPCDTDPAAKASGPLSKDCLVYLWNNGGGRPDPSGSVDPIGSTYSLSSLASSLFSKENTPRFCQASGSLSPLDTNGNVNQSAIEYWATQGGVNNVKAGMKKIHEMANANGLSDKERLPYLQKCYGVSSLAKLPGKSNSNMNVGYTETIGQDYPGVGRDVTSCRYDISPEQLRNLCDGDPDCKGYNVVSAWKGGCLKYENGPLVKNPMVVFYRKNQGHSSQGESGSMYNIYKNINLSKSPKDLTMEEFQSMFEQAGCTNKLSEGDVTWWRKQDTISGVQNDMNTYGSLTKSCSGNTRQHEFCIADSCKPDSGSGGMYNLYKNADIPGYAIDGVGPPGSYSCIGNLTADKCRAMCDANPDCRSYNVIPSSNTCCFKSIFSKSLIKDIPLSLDISFYAKTGFIPNVKYIQLIRNNLYPNVSENALNVSQVVVLDKFNKNVAKGASTRGSSDHYQQSVPSIAVDGTGAPRAYPNVFHSANYDGRLNVWIEPPTTITSVIVYNRSDCCQQRLKAYDMVVVNTKDVIVFRQPLNDSLVQRIDL